MQENLNEQPPKWSDIGDGNSKYITLETGKSYRVSISKVVLIKRAFKVGDEPKIKACCTIATIDGQPSNKIWETGSFSVMRELKKNIKDDIWMGGHILFLLKKKNEGDKISFVFEDLGTIEALYEVK